jgi:hypothetical protein
MLTSSWAGQFALNDVHPSLGLDAACPKVKVLGLDECFASVRESDHRPPARGSLALPAR